VEVIFIFSSAVFLVAVVVDLFARLVGWLFACRGQVSEGKGYVRREEGLIDGVNRRIYEFLDSLAGVDLLY